MVYLAEIDHSPVVYHQPLSPKTKIVRESASQTTPSNQQAHTTSHHHQTHSNQWHQIKPSQQIHTIKQDQATHQHQKTHIHQLDQPDFRTIVKVYEETKKHPDIVSACHTPLAAKNNYCVHQHTQLYEEPFNNIGHCTNLDEVDVLTEPHQNALGNESLNEKEQSLMLHRSTASSTSQNGAGEQFLLPRKSVTSYHKTLKGVNNLQTMTHRKWLNLENCSTASSTAGEIHPQTVSVSDNITQSSGDSYHMKAMNAIEALDAVVNTETSDQDEENCEISNVLSPRHPPVPPPPPLPGRAVLSQGNSCFLSICFHIGTL